MHEYGHTLQSRRWGMIYLPWVGLKSISSVKGTEEHHANQWYERQVSRMAKKYFVPKYNVKWNESENPTYLIEKGMKRILFLMAILFCFGCNPEKYTIVYWSFSVQNNADHPIVYAVGMEVLPNGKYHPVHGWPADSSGRLWDRCAAHRRSIFDFPIGNMETSVEDSISLFIFHPDTLAMYNWNEIKSGDKYLKRYDIKKREIGYYEPNANFTYP